MNRLIRGFRMGAGLALTVAAFLILFVSDANVLPRAVLVVGMFIAAAIFTKDNEEYYED